VTSASLREATRTRSCIDVQGFPGGRTFDNRIERDGEGRGGHFCRRTVNTTFTLRAKARLRLMEVTCHHNNVPGLILARGCEGQTHSARCRDADRVAD